MKPLRIQPELLSLLESDSLKDFTAFELKAAYMALPNCKHKSQKAARQFIYRNVERLEKKHLLYRLPDEDDDQPRYRFAGQLSNNTKQVHQTVSTISNNSLIITDDNLRDLKEKLHRYKVEMLSAIGEAEEYDAICDQLPHMQRAVQELYNHARDRSSKTLGRIRALESVLSHQQQLKAS